MRSYTCLLLLGGLLSCLTAAAQNTGRQLGAYYFDGWTGTYPYHITASLKDSFPEREPKWGWITSTQQIVDEQILTAAQAGLSFFSFCWYYSGADKLDKDPLNNALRLYHSSGNRDKLQYCLMVANHTNFYIYPKDWPVAVENWIKEFNSGGYVMVDGKPLLIFFSMNTLVKTFGSTLNVKHALDSLRNAAIASGLRGVTVAACTSPEKSNMDMAQECGFDVLTGYNYHSVGFSGSQKQIPIDSMQQAERRLWNRFSGQTLFKYIPVSTLNWDPRPWANATNGYRDAPYYIGYSPHSVAVSVRNCFDWLKNNPETATKEGIALLYAWNENGEGAYLTPTKNNSGMLDSLKQATLFTR